MPRHHADDPGRPALPGRLRPALTRLPASLRGRRHRRPHRRPAAPARPRAAVAAAAGAARAATPDAVGDPAWSLPGTFLHESERLADGRRPLPRRQGRHQRSRTRQPAHGSSTTRDRDARGWVLSVAHLAAVPYADLSKRSLAAARPRPPGPASRPGPLPYDHADIVTAAVSELRRLYRRTPTPCGCWAPASP